MQIALVTRALAFVMALLEGEGGVTAESLLSNAGTLIVSALGIVWNIITANVLLTIFVGASLLTLGFTFFRRAKRAARG